eukprot:26567-Chlamydomonas_euryale.AAC.1
MDGRTDGLTVRRMDGWVDGWTVGWMIDAVVARNMAARAVTRDARDAGGRGGWWVVGSQPHRPHYEAGKPVHVPANMGQSCQ